MAKNRTAFGDFLRDAIKQSGLSQSQFYTAVGITKPYFYDILSGKVNPPPSEIQYKMLEHLVLSESQYIEFLNLAANGRDEIPADISKLIREHSDKLYQIRKTLTALLSM